MKKVIISRYGAYGDMIHCSHLPHLLKNKGYDFVAFETNFKGFQIIYNNPYVDKVLSFSPENAKHIFNSKIMMERHWKNISEGYDLHINLINSLEHNIIAMETDPEYYMHADARKHMREINFYDQTSISAGFPEEVGKWQGEIYFEEEDDLLVKEWMKKFENKFVVMLNLSGTTIHKRYIHTLDTINYILSNIPNSHIITTGDNTCIDYDIKKQGVTSIVDKFPFKQALNIVKYCDLLISMESGIAVAANALKTPTIQLMTSSSLDNHPKYAENDYSIQSPAYCSPCSKGPYRFIGCPHKNGLPLCVYFKIEDIINQINKVYENYKIHQRISAKNRVSSNDASKVSIL